MTHPPPDVKKTIISNCLLKSPVERLLSSTQTAARSRAAAERVANQSYLAVYESISAHHTVGKKVPAWRCVQNAVFTSSDSWLCLYFFYHVCYLSFLVMLLRRVLNRCLGLVERRKMKMERFFKYFFKNVCCIHLRGCVFAWVCLLVQIQIKIQSSRFKYSKTQD